MKNTSQLFPSVVEILSSHVISVGVTQGEVIRGCRCVTTTCVVEDLASNALHSIAAIDDDDDLPAVSCDTIMGLAHLPT